MYQSVAVQNVEKIAMAMGGVRFFSRQIVGKSVNISADYPTPIAEDEVEDLFHLLKEVKVSIVIPLLR